MIWQMNDGWMAVHEWNYTHTQNFWGSYGPEITNAFTGMGNGYF